MQESGHLHAEGDAPAGTRRNPNPSKHTNDMRKRELFRWLLMLLAVVPAMRAAAQPSVQGLPMDPAVRYGKLDNGLTYYIRHNELPKERANFYIAQKVGSVQEDDNQRGLAHFLEHMCFNGTVNFPGNEVVRYCETIGVKFGENLNAYTSTDETVYNIDDVPVSDANVDSCLLILHDWADGLLLEPEEIDKERGVIHEEWRLRSSASGRILERNLPALYPGSKYGHRYPIGLMEIIDNFKPDFLRAYYEKWYRPDLQGIIVVGDVDVDKVEAAIKRIFSPIRMPENPAAYETYPVPDNAEAIYVIDKDKEQQQAVVQLMFKTDPLPAEYVNTPIFLVQQYVSGVASQVMNARLNELSQKPDCPFLAASCGYGDYIVSKTKDAFSVGILPKPGQDAAAVQAVMEEVERAARFGLTGSEVFRAKEEFISGLERIYDNRDKQKNSFYVPQYVRHFLEGEPIPDIETEFSLYKMLAQQIPAEVVSQSFKEMVASTDTNFVFLAMYPDKDGVRIPTVEEMQAAIAQARAARLTAYVDNVKDEPLVPALPAKGKVTKETPAAFGYTCWELSNGARVYFRKTDFNDSEVRFAARSFGGSNQYADADLVNVRLTDQVMNATGWGNFSSTELEKKLAGKQASVNSSIGEVTEGLSGQSTPKDLRTLFELTYLRFRQPADDQEAYDNTIALLRNQLANADKDPNRAFMDSIPATVYDHNLRAKSLTLADLDKADYAAIKRIYSERFNAAGDFDFFFTGNFDTDSLRLYVEQYLAPLPAVKERERFKDLRLYPRVGTVENRFVREMETPKAAIFQLWSGTNPYDMKNAAVIDALGQILTQRYLKSIREESGMAYSVGADGTASYGLRDDYTIQVYCPVKPAKADSALLLMEQGLLDIARQGVTDEELDKVKQFELKQYADAQRNNGYWQGLIMELTQWNKDNREGYENTIKSITSADIRKFVNDVLLKQHNRVTVVMLPASLDEGK